MCDSTVCIVQESGKKFISDAREFLELQKEKEGNDIGEVTPNSLDTSDKNHE